MHRATTNAIWLIAYLLMLGCVVGGVLYGRGEAIRVYGSKTAQSQWDSWKEEATRQAEGVGPVIRRKPKSAQPPALVLMRDYFAACLGIALLLSSVLFATLMLFVRGVAASPRFVDRSLPEQPQPRPSPKP